MVAVQDDGKIVLAGYDNSDFMAVRLLEDGSLDTSFNFDGIFDDLNFYGAGSHAWAGELQSDGTMVLVGDAFVTGIGGDYQFAAARLNLDGFLNPSFYGGQGWLTFRFPDMSSGTATAVKTMDNGRVVLAGYVEGQGGFHFGVAKLTYFGDFDPIFSDDGLQTIERGASLAFDVALTVQDDGKIILAGLDTVIRLDLFGELDTSFSDDGMTTIGMRALDIALQSDGKIVLSGYTGSSVEQDFAVARLNEDGSLDTSFSDDGLLTFNFPGFPRANATTLTIQDDGKIVLAGFAEDSGIQRFAAARLNSDGTFDTTFTDNGRLTLNPFFAAASDVAMQSDGNILLAGTLLFNMAVARLAPLPDQEPPTVEAITRLNAELTNAATVQYTVTFSEDVVNVDAADFTATTTGSVTGAAIIDVTAVSGSVYTVTVDTGSGSGTLRLDVPTTATISDLAGNALPATGYTSGESYSLDKTAPAVVSSVRDDVSPTNAAAVQYTVTFSEDVTGVDAADFAVTTTGNIGGAAILDVTPMSGSGYIVTVDTGSGDGTLRLDVRATAIIQDTIGNALPATGFTSGETYTLERLVPVEPPVVPETPVPLSVSLVPTRAKRGKPKKLVLRVPLSTGDLTQILSPFQKPKFQAIKAVLIDSDGDGVFDSVLFTARKGKKKVTRTISL